MTTTRCTTRGLQWDKPSTNYYMGCDGFLTWGIPKTQVITTAISTNLWSNDLVMILGATINKDIPIIWAHVRKT